MPIATNLYFCRIRVGGAGVGVGAGVGGAGQHLHVIPFLPLGENRFYRHFVFFTSTDPSPKMQVKMGVEKKVMMVNSSATQSAMRLNSKFSSTLIQS